MDTLVAVMTNTPDFVLAQKEHWYRIPCRSAPELLPSIQWLAFYHTAAFREAKWAVHYVAPVHAIDRMLRRDLLPEQADHVRAFEPYFRLRIGELERLEHSVPSARQRRIVFIPTTLVKLRAALEINDLYHESPLEDQLWTAFRHNGIAAERQYFVREQQTSYCLDFAVLCADGGVDVECDGDSWHLRREAVVEDNARNNLLARLGWRVLRFSTQELADPQMATTVGIIRATANQLGGIELPERVNRMFGRAATVADQLRLW
ncbi:MAG: endonuclease domain-containing protein [Dehalococcoidia bacterium]